jgi:hypothetical protein
MYKTMLHDKKLSSSTIAEYEEKVNSYLIQLFPIHISNNRLKLKNGKEELPMDYLSDVIIGLCLDNSLQFFETISLLMKCHFEISLLYENLNRNQTYDMNVNGNYKSPLKWIETWKDSEQLELFKYAYGAKLDYISSILYPLVLPIDNSANDIFPNRECFSIYMMSIILNDTLSYELADEEMKNAVECWKLNISLLKEKSQEEKLQWWHFAGAFFGLQKEIGECYLQLDSLRVRNTVIETKWLKLFSADEVNLKELAHKKKTLEIQITLKSQYPLLSRSRCLRQARQELLNEENELKKLVQNSTWAGIIDPDSFVKYLPNDSQVFKEYRLKAEMYFRIAVKLLHPDRRTHLLNGKILTKEQNDELNLLYHEVISIRQSKSFTALELISGDYFSVSKLKRIVAKAEMIISAFGINISKIKLMVLGEDYDSQIDFLTNEYNLLNVELAQIQAEVQALYSDKDIYQKDNILKDPEAIKVIHKRYNDITAQYTNDIAHLKDEYNKLFED